MPLVPGYHGESQDDRLLASKAGMIGYTVALCPLPDVEMHEPPRDVSTDDVLGALRDAWTIPVDSVQHLATLGHPDAVPLTL